MKSFPSHQAREHSPSRRKSAVPTRRNKYASRACQQCRQKRAKCGAERPACSRCLSRAVQCVYTTEDENRGSASRAYVRLLQSRVNMLEQIIRLHSIDVDASLAQLRMQGDLPFDDAVAGNHAPPFALEGVLCLDKPLNLKTESEARYWGSTSGRLEFEVQKEPDDDGSEISTDRSAISPSNTQSRFGSFSQILNEEPEVPEELVNHLIDLYFEWEQPWYQVVDETLFRQSKKGNGKYFGPLLLNCILAVGSRYSDLPEVRSDPEDLNTAGQAYLETAEVLLHLDLKAPTITTIQSLAVMAMFYVAVGSDARGWLHHGMAIRLSLDMGFNLNTSTLKGSSISTQETELRRQIYWALYCTDKLWASYTGRVCTMLDSQGMVDLPSVPAFDPTCNSHRSSTSVDPVILASLHLALSTQCQILETILLNLYAPKRLLHVVQRRNFFDACLLALRGWFHALSRELKIDRGVDKNEFPHAYVLNMVYHTSILLLTKPFLPASREETSSQSAPAQTQDPLPQKGAYLCLKAAKNICSLGNAYRQTFRSFRRCPVTATHCTLSAALVTFHATGAQAGSIRDPEIGDVSSCIKTLQELSISWTPAGRYWHAMERMVEKWCKATCSPASKALQGVVSDEDPRQTSNLTTEISVDSHVDQNFIEDLLHPSSDFAHFDQPMLEMPFWSGVQPELDLESLEWDYTDFTIFSSG